MAKNDFIGTYKFPIWIEWEVEINGQNTTVRKADQQATLEIKDTPGNPPNKVTYTITKSDAEFAGISHDGAGEYIESNQQNIIKTVGKNKDFGYDHSGSFYFNQHNKLMYSGTAFDGGGSGGGHGTAGGGPGDGDTNP